MITVNIDPIFNAAVEWFCAEEEYQKYLREYGMERWTGERSKAAERKGRNCLAAWDCLKTACDVLDLDPISVLRVVRSIAKHERNHGKYDRRVHWFKPFPAEENVFTYHIGKTDRAFIRACKYNRDAGYWRSTGRKQNF